MSTVLEKAKSHMRTKIGGGLKGPVVVTEWETEVWYKPATTFHQESKVIELQQAGKTVEALVQTLINRALDENGKNLFRVADKQDLMRGVDPAVILRVIAAMNDEDEYDGENLEEVALKN
tara:strand:- start:1343 stop:1702 length:360 start_codon:yes stop_codon:yes gene_type:complete